MFELGANSLFQAKKRHQLLATLIVNIITFGHGVGVGWLSPILAKLQTPDSPLDFKIGIAEISWLGSMLGLGSMFGNILLALLLERMGRKFCIHFMAFPYAFLWIFVYCAASVEYLYVARFLCGFTGGACYVVLPIFMSEIADSSIRGALSSIMMLSLNFGILIGYIMSSYLSYHLIPFLAICLPIAYFAANFFLPETAPYLLRHNKQTAAEASFSFYRNHRPSCKADFEELRVTIAKQQALSTTALSYKDFITRPALKAFGSAIVLSVGYQCSGVFSFINYMSDIFAASGSILDVNTCTIIIGVVQIVGVYTSTLLVDIVGRRILMLISTLGVGLGCICFGLFTYFAQCYDLSSYNWLPLVLMIIIIYVANNGLIGLFFLVLVELFPVKIRSVATSMSVVLLSILIFFTLKVFPLLLHHFGISITMWFSAVSSLLTFVYFLLFLPETKGKSMVED